MKAEPKRLSVANMLESEAMRRCRRPLFLVLLYLMALLGAGEEVTASGETVSSSEDFTSCMAAELDPA